ncbi:hypothetical protein [Holdemania filiformis]|uniref:hypothetical protein n=1 Tax=Holdemania filiformis TaxID=61171 RepID=UPI00242A3937|nr:hypothetical protein [Holdemania filiformis]
MKFYDLTNHFIAAGGDLILPVMNEWGSWKLRLTFLSAGAFLEIIKNEKVNGDSLELLSGLSIHSQSD